ncbi:ankyrin repeat-containing domain protein [Trichoderma evansii]
MPGNHGIPRAAGKGSLTSSNYTFRQGVPNHMTALHLVAYFGAEEVARALFHNTREVNAKDTNGRTPLFWAAKNGHEAVVKLLLEKGANLEAEDERGRTPLSLAAEYGHEAIVKLLQPPQDRSTI